MKIDMSKMTREEKDKLAVTERAKKKMEEFCDNYGKLKDFAVARGLKRDCMVPLVDNVVFNPPLTIVNWMDGIKTIVRCGDDEEFSEYVGFTACVAKRVFGGHNQYKRIIEGANRVQEKGGKK